MALDQSMTTQRPTFGHTINNEYTMANILKKRTTRKTESNTDLQREFKPIEEVGGLPVIAEDFMCTYTSISVLPDQFFKATVKYAPYFAPGILEDNRSLGDNNANAVAS